ncbi:uncharacterized protein [Littorina saxatilis]|uniref:uncharacterized protein n=1 Tax=Littorina saxatilis TaxID=31220 RepID=UPI0038B46C44
MTHSESSTSDSDGGTLPAALTCPHTGSHEQRSASSEQIGVLLDIERTVPKAIQALSVRVKENNDRNKAFFTNRSHLGKVVATVEASLTQESDNFTKSYLDNAEQTLVLEFAECTPLFGATTIILEEILCSYTEQSGWIWLGLGWLWFVLVPAIYLACVLLRFWQELLHVLDLHQHSCVRADGDLLVTDTAHDLGPSGVHDTAMDKTCDVINTTDTQSRVVEGPRDESNQLQPAMVGGANNSPASRGSAQSLHSATSQAKHRHTFQESYPSLVPVPSLDETHTQSCSDQSDTEMSTEDGTKEAQAVESRDRGVIDGVIGGRGVTCDPTQRDTDSSTSRFSPDPVDVDWMTKTEEWTTDDPNHVTFHCRLQLGAERVLCDWENGASETDDDIIGYNLELTSSETTWLVVSPDEDGQDSTESILGD